MAFFDTDCIELSKEGTDLSFYDRAKPLAEKLDLLYSFAEINDIRIIFTTPVGGRVPSKFNWKDVLFVPYSPKETSWIDKLDKYRLIYLERKPSGILRKFKADSSSDIFKDNHNANLLLEKLNIPHWIVFGNGIDLAINSVARNILSANKKVTLLSDVVVESPKGSDKKTAYTITMLCRKGVVRKTLPEFFKEQQIKTHKDKSKIQLLPGA